MKKLILFFVLLSSFVFSTPLDSVAKQNLNDTLRLLYDKDVNVVNKLLTSSDAVYGEYTSENYKYIYKLKVSGGDRIGIFIIQEIYDRNYEIIKKLNMKKGFVILVKAKAYPIVIFAGNIDDHGNSISSATLIKSGRSTKGKIEQNGDIDFFKIELSCSSRMVNIYTYGDTDTYGYLFNSYGEIITTNNNSGTRNNFKIRRRLSAGTYYISVQHSMNRTGSYSVQYNEESTCRD